MRYRAVMHRSIIEVEADSERDAKQKIYRRYGFRPDCCERLVKFKYSKLHKQYAKLHEEKLCGKESFDNF